MRKLKLQVQTSIDGYIAGTNGEMEWMEWNWGDDIKAYVNAITNPVDTIILGRKLAESFIPYWDGAAKTDPPAEGAEKLSSTHKVVFTKTLKTHDWENTELATGNLTEEINKLKNKEGDDIMAYGGSAFASSLIKENLVDEYHLLVNPTAIGKGLPIFEALDGQLKLQLEGAKAFDCGIIALHYKKV